jgi:hypothetical protein
VTRDCQSTDQSFLCYNRDSVNPGGVVIPEAFSKLLDQPAASD